MPHPLHPHDAEPVGFVPRTLASLADGVLEFVYVTILIALAGATPDNGISPNPEVAFIIEYLLPVVVTVMFWSRWQATPGKMMIRAHIVDARTGGMPTTGQFVIRYLGYIVSLIPLGLGFFWVMWDRRKQGWHDKLAGTMVVRTAAAPAMGMMERSAVAPPVAPVPAFMPAPAPRPITAGPWMNAAATEGQASLVWFHLGNLNLAEVAAHDLPGAASAVSAGASFPARAVSLGALHGATGEHDSGDLVVRYGDETGTLQETVASFGTPEKRGEFLHSLQARLGPAWSSAVVQGSRWMPVWNLVCVAVVIGLCTLGLQYVAEQMAAGVAPEIKGDNAKETLVFAVAYVLAGWLGSDVVGTIGGILLALCLLAFPIVLFSPPRHVVLHRRAGSAPAPAEASLALG